MPKADLLLKSRPVYEYYFKTCFLSLSVAVSFIVEDGWLPITELLTGGLAVDLLV